MGDGPKGIKVFSDHSQASTSGGETPPNMSIKFEVPSLPCLEHRKLPLNDIIFSSPALEPKPELVKGIHESLLQHLTLVRCSNELAAHFMLLHLLSKLRTCIGKVFTLKTEQG